MSILPRLLAITNPGPQRASVKPIFDALCTRDQAPLFSKVHYGSSIEDFIKINDDENGAVFRSATSEPLVVIIGAPAAPLILEYLIKHEKQRDRIKLVHSLWTGLDGFNVELLRQLLTKQTGENGQQPQEAIPVSNARGVFSQMLAEHVLLSILYFTRRVPLLLANRKNKIWDRTSSPSTSKMTMLVAGFGEIGTVCAKRAIGGLGMNVIGVRSKRTGDEHAPKPDEVCKETGALVVFGNEKMDALLPEADVVLAVLPNTPQTQNVFDEERFAKFKKGAIFINIGRGHTVDEAALVKAVTSGHLGGTAVDVFAKEPLPHGSELWDLDDSKFLFTPHNADVSHTMFEENAEFFAEEIAERFVLEGKLPEYLVDLEKGY